MSPIPSGMGFCHRQIHDRRCMVVLPVLDSGYISDVYGFSSDSGTAQLLIFVLYAITMLSIYGGKLPTIIINKTGMNPYAARMRAMFIFALFPLLALFAQPLGEYSYWYPIIIIGIAGAAHQSWSANIYSVVAICSPKCGSYHYRIGRYGGRYRLVPHQQRLGHMLLTLMKPR